MQVKPPYGKLKEELAKDLHKWYLEATKQISQGQYNPKAQVAYEDLTPEQKFIDQYIAGKVLDVVFFNALKSSTRGFIDAVNKLEKEGKLIIKRAADHQCYAFDGVSTCAVCGKPVEKPASDDGGAVGCMVCYAIFRSGADFQNHLRQQYKIEETHRRFVDAHVSGERLKKWLKGKGMEGCS